MSMKSNISRLTSQLFLLFLLFAPLATARAQNSPPAGANPAANSFDAQSFVAELHRLQGVIEKNQSTAQQVAGVRDSLPEKWGVVTPEGRYDISSHPLDSFLEKAQQDPADRSSEIANANQWLGQMAAQVESYGPSESQSDASARDALGKILARREFKATNAPSALDLFEQKIDDWIGRVLGWFLGRIGQHSTGAKIFFEILLALAVVWLVTALVRFWTRRARFDELQAPQAVIFGRTWQDWIRAARAAADRGEFREAVHAAYWGGISYLEGTGVIEADRARTPREYLRLLSKARPEAATSLDKPRVALAVLTARLEQVWYGRRAASREDFLDSMQQVEGLGCPLA